MKKMKLSGVIISMAVLTVTLTGCGKKDSSNSVAKLTREDVAEQQMEIMDKVSSGEITSEEADVLYAELSGNIETKEEEMKRTQSNISDFDGLPAWATKVGMVEPKGLTFIPEDSSVTEADGQYTDSFLAMYSGSSDEAVFEAARELATSMGLNISMDDESLLMANGDLGKYSASLVVADNGKGVQLTYSGFETP